jgi:hypothetical protein
MPLFFQVLRLQSVAEIFDCLHPSPSKSKLIGDVIMNRQNAATVYMF